MARKDGPEMFDQNGLATEKWPETIDPNGLPKTDRLDRIGQRNDGQKGLARIGQKKLANKFWLTRIGQQGFVRQVWPERLDQKTFARRD